MLQTPMASTGPLSAPNAVIPPRPKRQPRKLDYLKCSSCRKAKVKCVARHGAETDGRCTRCFHKNLVCSGLQRKAPTGGDRGSDEGTLIPNPNRDEADNDLDKHDALVLLSLVHIVEMGIKELLRIGTRQLQLMFQPSDPAWKFHAEQLAAVVLIYRNFNFELESRLKSARLAQHVSSAIISALMELTYPIRFVNDERSRQVHHGRADKYASESQYGLAYISQMRHLAYEETPDDEMVVKLWDNRDDLISTMGPVLDVHDISSALNIKDSEDCDLELAETQLFMPDNLLRIPVLVAAVEEDGRRDILDRLSSHILYDANVSETFGFDVYSDDYDALGRSTLHIACSMTTHERQMRQLDLTTVSWPGKKMLGFNALHIAAVRGDLEVFKTASTCGHKFFADADEYLSSETRWTYLHFAARYGHLELMNFLIAALGDRFDVLYNLDSMHKTALQYAARYGHTDIVKIILFHPKSEYYIVLSLHFDRGPFFSAIEGGHLDIIKLLEVHTLVDIDSHHHNDVEMLLTPLAEVARRGYIDCVRYFLNHGEVDINFCCDQKSPLDHAIANGHDLCVQLMRDYGAKTFVELVNQSDSDESIGDSD